MYPEYRHLRLRVLPTRVLFINTDGINPDTMCAISAHVPSLVFDQFAIVLLVSVKLWFPACFYDRKMTPTEGMSITVPGTAFARALMSVLLICFYSLRIFAAFLPARGMVIAPINVLVCAYTDGRSKQRRLFGGGQLFVRPNIDRLVFIQVRYASGEEARQYISRIASRHWKVKG